MFKATRPLNIRKWPWIPKLSGSAVKHASFRSEVTRGVGSPGRVILRRDGTQDVKW